MYVMIVTAIFRLNLYGCGEQPSRQLQTWWCRSPRADWKPALRTQLRRENPDLSTPRHPLRIVIQQIVKTGTSSFRIVAYGDSRSPRHSDFESRDALLKALHSAVPGFDDAGVSINMAGGNQTSIVFAGEMDLDDNQLSILGLS